jgi:hypothetical protein
MALSFAPDQAAIFLWNSNSREKFSDLGLQKQNISVSPKIHIIFKD